jgi:hypothetical protein
MVAAFVLSWPSIGWAQREAPTGSNILRARPAEAPDTLGTAEAGRVALPEFAACLVDHDRPDVERIIAGFPDDKQSKALNRLAGDECLASGELTVTDRLLRGALYAELYRRSFTDRAPSIADATVDWSTDAAGQPAEEAGLYVALRQFAQCLVQKHSGESRQLMFVPPRSHREDDALRAMTPDMAPCLVQGAQIRFSKDVLEGLIAEVLYRLSVVGARVSATTPARK